VAGGWVGAVEEQDSDGFKLAAVDHADKRSLPVFRAGFPGQAFGEGAFKGCGVALEDVGDAVEAIEVKGVE